MKIYKLTRPHPSEKDAFLVLYVRSVETVNAALNRLKPSELDKCKIEVITVL